MILRYFILFILLICFNKAEAQNFTISVRSTGSNVFVSSLFLPKNNITICLTKRGNIANIYRGNITDSDNFADDDITNIDILKGTNQKCEDLNITYYDNFDWEELKGKVKSIGSLTFTYYDRFGWDETKGKLKSIGDVNFTYYDRFGWDETKGKLKSVGNFEITYYDRFDWDELKGKMKTIGKTTFIYYDRFDTSYKLGRLKTVNGNTDNLYVFRPISQINDF